MIIPHFSRTFSIFCKNFMRVQKLAPTKKRIRKPKTCFPIFEKYRESGFDSPRLHHKQRHREATFTAPLFFYPALFPHFSTSSAKAKSGGRSPRFLFEKSRVSAASRIVAPHKAQDCFKLSPQRSSSGCKAPRPHGSRRKRRRYLPRCCSIPAASPPPAA